MDENKKKQIPWLMYLVIPAIPLIAAGNYSLGMNAEVGLFVWEFLALLLWAWVSISRPTAIKDLLKMPSFSAAALFMSWMLLSLTWSAVLNDALFETLRYLSGVLLFLAILQSRPANSDVRRIVILLFASSALVALYGIYQGVWGFSQMLNYALANNFSAEDIRILRETQRPFATFFHTNAFAGYLAAMIPLGVLAYSSLRNKALRSLIGLALIATIVALLFTSSRGGWLCGSLAVVLSAAVILKKHGIKTAALFATVLLLSVAIYSGALKLSETLPDGEQVQQPGTPIDRVEALVGPEDLSKSSRITYWQTALRMGVDFQPQGAGLGSYEHLCRQYLTVPAYSRNPHNIWIQYFAEIGIIGLLLFIAMLLALLRDGIRSTAAAGSESETAWLILISAGIMLLHASFDLDIDGPAGTVTLFALAGLIVSARLPRNHSAVSSTELILRTVFITAMVVCVVGLHFVRTLAANYTNLSDLSSENGSDEKALEFNIASVEMWPYNPVTMYKLSVLYAEVFDKTGDKAILEKSLDTALKAIELNPYQAEYFAGLAMLYELLGRKEEALDAARKASQLYPIGIRYHTLYAHMMSLQGRKEEALTVIDNALRNADNYIKFKSPDGYDVVEAQFVKATILNELKRFDEAMAEYDRVNANLKRGLVISPFSSSRHNSETMESIRKRVEQYHEKSRIEKQKLESGVTQEPDPVGDYLKKKGILKEKEQNAR